ncbi:MAG TPA: hydrogenase nickel incorporation protein HypB [Candidatus Binataceae bacterium]|jgi:hydrogenase nickel incorporation protein HypB|nr:hydrogenase nickel incorporation protein HypB [Candidatus Binataceae bacterium]
MCSTCGCSEGAKPVFTNPDKTAMPAREVSHAHEHDHEHPHAHDHDHDHHHGAGAHEHPHALAHEAEHRTIRLEQDILAKNHRLAERNRGWFEGREIFAVNLMSSPGAGKTTLLERTIRDLGGEMALSVIEGDQETLRDAERIRAAGGKVVQVNTGTGCHLDAEMLNRALRELEPPLRSVVIIENVGNLVCPALFDLGEGTRVVIMSVTEGEDKPLKYPHMFRAADAMILSKVDLLPHLEFDVERCLEYAHRVNPRLKFFQLSATRGAGLEYWYAWLRSRATS